MPAGLGARFAGLVLRYGDIQQNPPCPAPSRRVGLVADYPSGTYQIVDNANTQVLFVADGVQTIEKIGGSAYGDAGAVSSVGLTGDFVLRVTSTVINGGIIVGMNSDPLTDNDYASIDYAWQNPFSSLGGIFESGVFIGTIGGGTYHWIWRIGTDLYYGRGANLAAAQVSPDRTVPGASATLYFDIALLSVGDKVEVLLADLAATTAYSLTADAGTFSYTGQAANLLQGYNLTAAQATFTYAGQSANLLRNYRLDAAQATFSYTGQAANLKAAYSMAAAQATFSYTGQAAGLLRGYRLDAAQGAFTYAGQVAQLTPGFGLVADTGAFTYAGQDAAFHVVASLAAAFGSFSYAGQGARATLNLAMFPPATGGSGVKVAAVIM